MGHGDKSHTGPRQDLAYRLCPVFVVVGDLLRETMQVSKGGPVVESCRMGHYSMC